MTTSVYHVIKNSLKVRVCRNKHVSKSIKNSVISVFDSGNVFSHQFESSSEP